MSVEQGEDAESGEETTADDADAESAAVDAEVSDRAELRCGISLGPDDD
ncbi:hypothetical protein ACFQDG_11850 [Natronoarchaeum mannanilyticum]